MLAAGSLFGPKRDGAVKQMPYESGMDPIHDARRRFDVRFHLVAIAFLLFDVEVLFLYPWAVANKNPDGLATVVPDSSRLLILGKSCCSSPCSRWGSSTHGEKGFSAGVSQVV